MPFAPRFLPTLPHLLEAPRRPFIHRDLSALQFNERVLAEARASATPLLERVKFLAITGSNLDEFFMIRYASLDRSIRVAAQRRSGHAGHLKRVRTALLDMVAAFTAKQAETLDLLAAALAARGVRLVRRPDSSDPAFDEGKALFEQHILPELRPPEPFRPSRLMSLDNLCLAAVFPTGLWFVIPRSLPPVFVSPPDARGEIRWHLLDDLLYLHLGPAFRLTDPPALLRLTRDGDIPVHAEGDDPASIPDMVRSGLGSRDRGRPVRLQYAGDASPEWLNQTLAALRLSPRQILPAPGSLVLQGLWSALGRLPEATRTAPELSIPPLRPFLLESLRSADRIFDVLKERDILLHHPYESFEGYVNFIRAACADSSVTRIQQTVYRTDALSPVVEALKGAARKKKIRVLIELRARFDEMNNLRLADDLRRAGVEVAFGFGRLKVHAKIALVTRTEGGTEKLYTHLSTGNYNAATARAYEDLAVLTSDPALGEDARRFFDAVCAGEIPTQFQSLVPAPAKLHRRLLQLIQQESEAAKAGRPAYLFAKVNALVDRTIVESLYAASQAGVAVDLVVRGACALIPGVKGLSENVRVISLVDRFLEHSRIYYFAAANRMYLSSADWMPRNFFSRLELAFPVRDERLFRYIRDVVVPVYLADTVKGRELTAQGTWRKRSVADTSTARARRTSPAFVGQSIRAQFYFEELANRGYRGTPLSRSPEVVGG